MEYKGFTILHDKVCGRWIIVIDIFTQWYATDDADARKQINEYHNRKSNLKTR